MWSVCASGSFWATSERWTIGNKQSTPNVEGIRPDYDYAKRWIFADNYVCGVRRLAYGFVQSRLSSMWIELSPPSHLLSVAHL